MVIITNYYIYIININPVQSSGIELLTRREGENPGKGVYSVTLFAVYNLCVNLGYLDAFMAEKLAHGVKILLLA